MKTGFAALARGIAMIAGLAVASPAGAQDVLVGDLTNGIVARFGLDGSPIDHFVAAGVSALDQTRGIVRGPSGDVFIASFASDEVFRYDGHSGAPRGAFVTAGSGGLSSPIGLAFGPDGNLYVASAGTNEILRYDGTTGAFIDAFVAAGEGGLDGPNEGLLFDDDGSLLVASHRGDAVLRFDADGTFVEEVIPRGAAGLDGPGGFARHPDGRLLVCSYASDSVLSVDAAGLVTAFAGPTSELDGPTDIVVAPDNSILVSFNLSGGGVVRLDPDGALVETVISGTAIGLSSNLVSLLVLPRPCSADFDGDGELTIFDFLAFQNAFDAGCP